MAKVAFCQVVIVMVKVNLGIVEHLHYITCSNFILCVYDTFISWSQCMGKNLRYGGYGYCG